ncbi:MAG: hypothetical protein Q9190_001419 [Brigantiaea leucoxantha]
MPSLLELPSELRENIWAHLVHHHSESFYPYSAFELLRTSKQFRKELAPYLYHRIVFHLHRPYQALHWIYRIGSFNGSCVHSLVLRFSSIQDSQSRDNASDIWAASLQCLPNLKRLAYEYDPFQKYNCCRSARLDDHPVLKKSFLDYLPMFISPNSVKSNTRYIHVHTDNDENIFPVDWQLRKRPITHAILAIDEPMPEVLILPYKKHLHLDPTVSLEQNLTGCFPSVFQERNLHPSHTFAFVETPEKPFISLAYTKSTSSYTDKSNQSVLPVPGFRHILNNLLQLIYLRIGCPSVDSSILDFVPSTIQTLDVAITDPDPTRVASNISALRPRCNHLFTLAIAVSPLHDDDQLPYGGRQIDQSTVVDESSEWEPFWQALKAIQASGVRVWEGEGPGFRNTSYRNNR